MREWKRAGAFAAPTENEPPAMLPRGAGVTAERRQVGDELRFRASGGRAGTPPMARIDAERQQVAASLNGPLKVHRAPIEGAEETTPAQQEASEALRQATERMAALDAAAPASHAALEQAYAEAQETAASMPELPEVPSLRSTYEEKKTALEAGHSAAIAGAQQRLGEIVEDAPEGAAAVAAALAPAQVWMGAGIEGGAGEAELMEEASAKRAELAAAAAKRDQEAQEPAETKEEPAQDEPSHEEAAQEEPASEQPAQEETAHEEAPQEESPQEESPQPEPAQAEPSAEEPAKAETDDVAATPADAQAGAPEEEDDEPPEPICVPVTVAGETHEIVADPAVGMVEIHSTPGGLGAYIKGILIPKYPKHPKLPPLLPIVSQIDAQLSALNGIGRDPARSGERLDLIHEISEDIAGVKVVLSSLPGADLDDVYDVDAAVGGDGGEILARLEPLSDADLRKEIAKLSDDQRKGLLDVCRSPRWMALGKRLEPLIEHVEADEALAKLAQLKPIVDRVRKMDPALFRTPAGASAPVPQPQPGTGGIVLQLDAITSAVASLKGNWKDQEGRRKLLEDAVNAALGLPKGAEVGVEIERIETVAQFNRKTWSVHLLDDAIGKSAPPRDDELAEIGNHVSHEARHAEQHYRKLLLIMYEGLGLKKDCAAISATPEMQALQIKPDVVKAVFAAAQPVFAAGGASADPEAELWRSITRDHKAELDDVNNALSACKFARLILDEVINQGIPPWLRSLGGLAKQIDGAYDEVLAVYKALPHEIDAFAVGDLAEQEMKKLFRKP